MVHCCNSSTKENKAGEKKIDIKITKQKNATYVEITLFFVSLFGTGSICVAQNGLKLTEISCFYLSSAGLKRCVPSHPTGNNMPQCPLCAQCGVKWREKAPQRSGEMGISLEECALAPSQYYITLQTTESHERPAVCLLLRITVQLLPCRRPIGHGHCVL